ncbi:hypothetical protein K435DRAFT_827094 [Dendrothele bispora CBS 962.96]|uniref:Ribosomal RNA-processing protein 43 n=1 Tax=Dendrothele bispora (strain CBS 962.96) TaxID=1314807 RepID=A0A4S8MLB8_DENBC|nr:hypothetical protein K435DRAFT_827094 [Dendrothele bispora CBS 962.96]
MIKIIVRAAGSPNGDALKAAIFQRLHPRTYLERFLAEGVRPDGRDLDEWRSIELNVGSISTANGSALVKLGQTTIVCGVKAEIAEPELDCEEEGFLVPNIDLPALCSPKFKPGPPSEEAQVLSERLNQTLFEGPSSIISRKSLCIEPGKAVWTLYIDATVINYDGNAFDAAVLAMVCALRNSTLPYATYNPETNRTICTRPNTNPDKPAMHLKQLMDEGNLKQPMAFSFGVVHYSSPETDPRPLILPDPTSFEEPLLETTLTVVLNSTGQLVNVEQIGASVPLDGTLMGSTDDIDLASRCIAMAKKRFEELEGTRKKIQAISD